MMRFMINMPLVRIPNLNSNPFTHPRNTLGARDHRSAQPTGETKSGNKTPKRSLHIGDKNTDGRHRLPARGRRWLPTENHQKSRLTYVGILVRVARAQFPISERGVSI